MSVPIWLIDHHIKQRLISSKILIVGALACLSAVAVAQSDQTKEKTPAQSPAAAPRDAVSGQATGKRMHKPMTVTADASTQDAAAGKTPAKTMASDDWQTSAAKGSAPKTASQATAQNSASASSDVKSPRDVSTGQASGKSQHQPVPAAQSPEVKPKQ